MMIRLQEFLYGNGFEFVTTYVYVSIRLSGCNLVRLIFDCAIG